MAGGRRPWRCPRASQTPGGIGQVTLFAKDAIPDWFQVRVKRVTVRTTVGGRLRHLGWVKDLCHTPGSRVSHSCAQQVVRCIFGHRKSFNSPAYPLLFRSVLHVRQLRFCQRQALLQTPHDRPERVLGLLSLHFFKREPKRRDRCDTCSEVERSYRCATQRHRNRGTSMDCGNQSTR